MWNYQNSNALRKYIFLCNKMYLSKCVGFLAQFSNLLHNNISKIQPELVPLETMFTIDKLA